MKRSSRDALLMLGPVALLGVFGWLLSSRKPAVIKPTGPFKPFIRRVQVLPARPIDVFDGYDTRVVVELDARGQLPLWWTQRGNSYYGANGGQLVAVKGNKTEPLGKTGYRDSPHIDSQRKSWVSTYNLKLREVAPQSGQIRLRDVVKFTDNRDNTIAKLWLDTPLRANRIATKVPTVPRIAGMKIEKFTLDSAPPTESHDGIQRWRAQWILHENVPLTMTNTISLGANMRVKIVNRRGTQVGSVGQSRYSSEDDSTTAFSPNKDPRRRFIGEDYALDSGVKLSKTEPLYLQGDIRSGDKWPLSVKIPFRDATGKMLLTPRTPTLPFRVLSVKKITPTADEIKEYGSDAVVAVTLQAWNPKADVSQWRWEIDYSQHLHSANAGDIWELPFKPGKSTFLASYNWPTNQSVFKLRYQLVLKSVPAKAGKLVFHADMAANRSRRVPVEVTVRP